MTANDKKDVKTDTQNQQQTQQDQQTQQTKTSTAKTEAGRKVEDMSPEELEAAQQEWVNRFFPNKKKEEVKTDTDAEKKKKEEEAAAAKKKEEEAAAAKKKADEEAAAKKAAEEKKQRTVPPLPTVDAEPSPDPAEAIADRVAEKIKPVEKQSTVEMTEAQKLKIAAFERMEKDHASYKGLKDRVVKYWQAEDAYITRWQAEHPDEEFDAEAAEHRDWYRKNMPDYDDDDFEVAMEREREDRVASRIKSSESRQNRQEETRQRLQAAAPAIQKAVGSAIVGFVSQATQEASPEVAKLLSVDGKIVESLEDDALVAKMEEADPVATTILVEAGEPLAIMLSELERMTTVDGYKPQLDRIVQLKNSEGSIAPARQVISFIMSLEKALLAKPPEETLDNNGRRLIANAHMNEIVSKVIDSKLSDAQKQAKLNEIDQRYYVLGPDDFRQAIIADHASRASKRIEKIKKVAGSKSTSTEKKETNTQGTTKADNTNNSEASAGRRKAPSVETASDMTDTRSTAAGTTEEQRNYFVNKSFGRIA